MPLWRGVILEYRDRLPITDATPIITLQEGGTPLVPAEALSARTGLEGLLAAWWSELLRLNQNVEAAAANSAVPLP